MPPSMTWKQILAVQPCANNRALAHAKLKAALPDFKKRSLTLADAAAAGIEFDDLIWIAGRAAKQDSDCARRIRLFGADCAARVAHIANDPRSTAAIVAARAFARGEITEAQLAAARDARAAAGDAAGDAARDARAAARAAASGAAWAAAWAAASGAAWAAAWAAASGAAWAAECQWQRDRLVAWFSDEEPTDWPISEPAKAEAA